MMRFGVKLPNCAGIICDPQLAQPQYIEMMGKVAEELGYDSVWLHDHLSTPDELRNLQRPDFFEPMIVACRLAALTSRIRIGVATIILPLRDPVLLAKQVATLDSFAPGRFVLGVGAGRYEDEFDSLGNSQFSVRGRVLDENLQIVRDLWSKDEVTLQGKFRTLTRVRSYPKPVTLPPIWIGGNSEAAVRRAARIGDGWVPAALTVRELLDARERLEHFSTRYGRDPRAIEMALSLTIEPTETDRTLSPSLHAHPRTRRVSGTLTQIADQFKEYAQAGVSTFLISFNAGTINETLDRMAAFAEQVRLVSRGKVKGES